MLSADSSRLLSGNYHIKRDTVIATAATHWSPGSINEHASAATATDALSKSKKLVVDP
jgi:hypothetical protein